MKKFLYLAIILFASSFSSFAQKVNEPTNGNPQWKENYAPFRIAGNLYYVGTYDLASYLICTEAGHILINTGLASSAKQVKRNVQQLGFKFKDIKILLTTQAHYDHMGAMAAIKKQTGAQFFVTAGDKETAASGGKADYEMGKYGVTFKPIHAEKILNNFDSISLGETHLQVINHPGHTQGSCSYLFTVKDSSRSYKVLIANMPSIVTDRRFQDIKEYTTVSNDYANSLASLKSLEFDIWVASHASQFGLHKKRKPGDAYNPSVFFDQKGYMESLEELKKDYEEKLKKDAAN